ncbi:MAG: DUF3857 and transglutaminase domain-containing protein [Ferruginibacter sp.]
MRRSLLFVVLILSFNPSSFAGDGEYNVAKLSPALLKNANAVSRLEELRFEINSLRQTVLKNHYVITILNEKGDGFADFSEYYDKHRQIISVEGILYDANGKQIKRTRKKDIEDLSGVSDESLMDDNRVRRHNFYYKVYPYTIEYTVEVLNKNTLFFPQWIPQHEDNLSVEHSSISIIAPLDYEVRYKMFNYPGTPITSMEKNMKVSTWSTDNMPAIKRELYSPSRHEITTMVIFGPSDFAMGEYKGTMVSWQDFGKFVYTLKQGREILPENVMQIVHSIADGISDPKEKISRLYEFMQQNTRYISVQLGIGGWQPYDAKYVAAKGYGDCKALTNYMFSILKEAGIPSYYTLVRSGADAKYITEDFPSQQFNHVILCVPLQKDTVWLECTDQTIQAGYLGDFTSDRPALLIDETGGKLVNTPKYGVKENQQYRHIKAALDENGALNLIAASRYSGLLQDEIHALIRGLSKDKVKELLNDELNFSTYEINQFAYKEQKTSIPSIDELLDITVSNYAAVTGKRLFIVPNIMSRSNHKLDQESNRTYDVQLTTEYKEVDTVEIELPAGYTPETIPPPVIVKSKFGNYSSSVKLEANKVYYYRSMEQNSGRFAAASYAELVKFYESIYRADRNKIVLVKN